jgi:hypothetical protein
MRFGSISVSLVESRRVSSIAPKRDLLVAGLFPSDLKGWGLSAAISSKRRNQAVAKPFFGLRRFTAPNRTLTG